MDCDPRVTWVSRLNSMGRAAVVTGLALSCAGCGVLHTAMIVFKGQDVPADFKGLNGKRVAVICRPADTFGIDSVQAAGDLARDVGGLLRENVPRITVISHSEVEKWYDLTGEESFAELGKALNAELVVGIDLEHFSLHEGSTLYQGKAEVQITVVDPTDGKVVWETVLSNFRFPTNAIPALEKPENSFRREFVRILAERISIYFYKHDAYGMFAIDSRALN